MKSAYNPTWLHNLMLVKEAKRWKNEELISAEQLTVIREAHPSSFIHPNLMIRVLLFLATLVALGGVTGFLALIFASMIDDGEAIYVLTLLYGIGSFIFLDRVFIANARHYKSGVTEALLYHAIGYALLGLAGMSDFDVLVVTISCLILFSFAAYRYLDLISTACALLSLAYLIFYLLYEAGGIMQQIIPIVFLIVFTPLYFVIHKTKSRLSADAWASCLTLLESLCLLLIYAAGNYFVVRELSIELMGLYLEEGQDIPFAFLFYALTVIIPVTYLYFAIKTRDIVLLRVSLFVIAFSVFTFKYYFSLGHPEITLTLAGAILLVVTLYLFRLLKTPKAGFTRDSILREKWAEANPEAFIMSQTLGGNQATADPASGGGGGTFSGGGSTDSF